MRRALAAALALVLFASLGRAGGPEAAREGPRGSENVAPARRTENVVLVVIDGLRWQEVFTGAEAALIDERAGGVEEPASVKRDFWRPTPGERRETLMPFLWDAVARRGALWGNAAAGSPARVTNGYRFSYPGYNEILTGAADPRIDANSYGPNPNVTVFEWLAASPDLRDRVAVVAGWDAFPRIFHRARSGLPMWTGWDPPFPNPASPRQSLLDALYATTTRYFSDMPFDAMLQQTLLEVVAARRPRVLFVGFGESDEWAHAGRYDLLLRSARAADGYVRELWETLQGMPEYAGKTALLVTTDHGRGAGTEGWRHHDWNVDGAENVWIAALGPDTPALGELRDAPAVTQSQIAATIAALLGKDWRAQNPAAGAPIPQILGK